MFNSSNLIFNAPLHDDLKTESEAAFVANAAAAELWDLILAPSSRYTEAQRDRTLYHPSLPQPSADEEQINLKSRSEQNSNNEFVVTCEEKCLQERLSKLLEKAGIQDQNGVSSPTSTLMFLDPAFKPVVIQDILSPFKFMADTHTSSDSNPSVETIKSSTYMEYDKPDRVQMLRSELKRHSESHSFVICADTQLGMTNQNRDWSIELDYARKAVSHINNISPKPKFCICCGDLVDMEFSFYAKPGSQFTKEQCDKIQDQQNHDFKRVWSQLDPAIPIVCVCGNHDIGNTPTKSSIDKFRSAFGDEYLAFWTNGTYNIVLNNVLFSDPTGAPDMFEEQLDWLRHRLQYATSHGATHIFVFAHHPWFLYDENEVASDLNGLCPFPAEWGPPPPNLEGFPDSYFHIQKNYRDIALDLFKKYNVDACFSGHFHQNVVSKSSWGMDMIITAPLSITFESTGKPAQREANGRGVRVVNVSENNFTHHFELLSE